MKKRKGLSRVRELRSFEEEGESWCPQVAVISRMVRTGLYLN